MLSLKLLVLAIGIILSVIGIFLNNWKLSAVGNLLGLIGVSGFIA